MARLRTTIDVSARRGFGGFSPLVCCRARRTLLELGFVGAELSIALVDEPAMQELNTRWRGKNRPTDVLSFASDEGEPEPAPGIALGDVIVCVPVAEVQGRRAGHGTEREIETLLVHGILHLLGHDHERSRADARRMFALQRRLLG